MKVYVYDISSLFKYYLLDELEVIEYDHSFGDNLLMNDDGTCILIAQSKRFNGGCVHLFKNTTTKPNRWKHKTTFTKNGGKNARFGEEMYIDKDIKNRLVLHIKGIDGSHRLDIVNFESGNKRSMSILNESW